MLGWITTLSVVTFIVSLIVVPIIVVRIPAQYFDSRRRHVSKLHVLHPVVYVVAIILKNLFALLLVLGGIIMLVLPGQGVLTILIGIGVSDFPGKYRVEKKLVKLPGVLTAINWIRRKAGVHPLLPPDK